MRHPNVVAVHDLGQSEALGPFLVMEYIEGCDLAGLLKDAWKRKQPVPVPVIMRIVLDLLEGLGAAHGPQPTTRAAPSR